MKTFIIVRTASTRLPKKCLLPLGNCQTVLQHVIMRCKTFDLEPVVCTTTAESDSVIHDIATDEGIKCFRGPLNNVEMRLMMCAKWCRTKTFHALDCDDPYFCPEEIRRSMAEMQAKSLGILRPTLSSTEYALGMMGSSYDLYAEGGDILSETPHVYRKWRLTLDYQEDYWLLATLARHHGFTPSRWIIDEQAGAPLQMINQFRMKEWKEKQCREILTANTMATN